VVSIRVTLKNEARRLAAAVDDADTTERGYHVPNYAILRLHRMLQNSDQPADVLRWAWRSQLASYVDTGSRLDGLATIYLHAALLDMEHNPTIPSGGSD
jgi:hypothetical protein